MNLTKLFSKSERELRPKVVRPDDVFIVSYPKSGNTWQRFLVANLVCPGGDVTYLNINRIVADIYQVPEEELAGLPSPRMFKSHEAFTPRFLKVVYVTRDPRSVAVSMYHFLIATKKLEANHSIDGFLEGFLRGEYYRNFKSWGANVTSWLSERDRGNENILVVRYEDLKANTTSELRRVADFLGLNATDATIQAAVENSSFQKMQNLEHERFKETRQYVRKGKVDEWKETFSAEQIEKIHHAFGGPMRQLKYL